MSKTQMHTDYRKTAFTLELNILTLVAIPMILAVTLTRTWDPDLVPEATDTHQTK